MSAPSVVWVWDFEEVILRIAIERFLCLVLEFSIIISLQVDSFCDIFIIDEVCCFRSLIELASAVSSVVRDGDSGIPCSVASVPFCKTNSSFS